MGIKNADGRDKVFALEVGGLLNCGNVGKDCRVLGLLRRPGNKVRRLLRGLFTWMYVTPDR